MTRRGMLHAAAAVLLMAASAASARADQLDDIMKSGTLRISTDFAVPPAGMMDGAMQPTGSDVETARLIAQDWGLKLEFIPTTGSTRIPNLLSGKADIIVSTLSVTAERAKVIDFSRPYTILQSVVSGGPAVKVTEAAGLKGMTVAVARGTTQDNRLTSLAAANGFNVQRYDDDATLVTAAATGQSLLIGTSLALSEAVQMKNPAAGFAPKFVLDNFDIAVGVKKGEGRLLAKVNEWVLANLQNGRLNNIYKRFYKVELPASLRPPEVR